MKSPSPAPVRSPGVCKALGLPNHLAEAVEQDVGDPDFLAKSEMIWKNWWKNGRMACWIGLCVYIYIYTYIIYIYMYIYVWSIFLVGSVSGFTVSTNLSIICFEVLAVGDGGWSSELSILNFYQRKCPRNRIELANLGFEPTTKSKIMWIMGTLQAVSNREFNPSCGDLNG